VKNKVGKDRGACMSSCGFQVIKDIVNLPYDQNNVWKKTKKLPVLERKRGREYC